MIHRDLRKIKQADGIFFQAEVSKNASEKHLDLTAAFVSIDKRFDNGFPQRLCQVCVWPFSSLYSLYINESLFC